MELDDWRGHDGHRIQRDLFMDALGYGLDRLIGACMQFVRRRLRHADA